MAKGKAVAGWVLYDMANTLFSLSVVSVHFPLYLKGLGLPDAAFATTASASMAVMLLLSPALGALSDRARRRIPFLVVSTVTCVLATAPLGLVPWQASLALFALANVGFLSGLVFYDALLPTVAIPERRGRVGALGVAVGYVGSFIGLSMGVALTAAGYDDATVFAVSAALFLLLALPSFLWVRESTGAAVRVGARDLVAATGQSFRGLAAVLRGRDGTGTGRFLASRVFYTDAVNTMILFMAIYVTGEVGFTDGEARAALAVGIAGAALGTPLWGLLVDRRGPQSALRAVLGAWMAGLALVAAFPLLGLPPAAFHGLAAFLGACLGGTWAADRPLLAALAPPERMGEYFGYYGMVGRFSAIAGPMLWALVVDVLGLGRPAAVATLLVAVAVGWWLLGRVRVPAAARPSIPTAGA